MQRYWFKPKRYGLGAAPASWQGWALVAAYVVAMSALGLWLTERPGEPRLVLFLTLTAVITIIFLGVCWRTTQGGWHWRWGKD